MTLLVKAAKEVGFAGKLNTFYGNALGAPAAMGEAGVGRVVAVADWLHNVQTTHSEAFYQLFRQRFPKPDDDYVQMRVQLMIQALAQSIEKAGTANAVAVPTQLEITKLTLYSQSGTMRASDHQFQERLVVGELDRRGALASNLMWKVPATGFG